MGGRGLGGRREPPVLFQPHQAPRQLGSRPLEQLECPQPSPARPAECWFKPRARGEPGATHSQWGLCPCQPCEANCQVRAGCDPRSHWLVNHRPRPVIGQNSRGARREKAELGGRVRAERAASCGPDTRRAQLQPSFYLVCLLI